MTLHPCRLPESAPDVPGLAYYSAQTAKPLPPAAPKPRSAAIEALDAMYGYYSPQA